MLRILFVGFIVLTCIIKTQDALFSGGRSMQHVRNIDEYFQPIEIVLNLGC